MDTKVKGIAEKCIARKNIEPQFPYTNLIVQEAIVKDGALIVLLQDGRKFVMDDWTDMIAKYDRLAQLEKKVVNNQTIQKPAATPQSGASRRPKKESHK